MSVNVDDFINATTKGSGTSILETQMTISKLLLGVTLALSVAACTTVEGPSDKAISVSFKNQAGSSYLAGYNPVPVRAAVGKKRACLPFAKSHRQILKAPRSSHLPK
ncbi:hypothetical protein [Shimia sp. MIT1388]|uniref:hypothetical protein n=1 Tax=Shimia sp. MIT1388 TaxID=3096992 RepID=UPI00399A9373